MCVCVFACTVCAALRTCVHDRLCGPGVHNTHMANRGRAHTSKHTGNCHPASHSVDTAAAGWQAKRASIELWIHEVSFEREYIDSIK